MADQSQGRAVFTAVVLLLIVLPTAGLAQDRDFASGIRVGLGYEQFSQTLSWDDLGTKRTSDLESQMLTLVLAVRPGPRLFLSGVVGYASSDFGGLRFRRLPFSVEIESSGMSGLLLGGDASVGLIRIGGLEMGIAGQYVAFFGATRTLELPGLAVSGEAETHPSWTRAVAGPVLSFGRSGFRPFLFPNIRYFEGRFRLSETISDLKGEENKDLKGKGLFGLTGGVEVVLGARFTLRAEAGVYPHKEGTDISVRIRTMMGL